MIITGLKAQNVLKYASLEFNDLPAEGLIAVSGANESGKSSIGETICFALFGRTFAIGPADIEKVIRWGESRCHVSLTFRMPSGDEYEISRYLDRDGNQSARIGPANNPDAPMARGISAVSQMLFEILGYDYAEFIESFYLAQREISTPHPHSGAVRMMSGVTPLEGARETFAHDVENENSSIVGLDEQDIALQEELAELGIDSGHLQRLEDKREAISRRRDDNDRRGEELSMKAEHYISLLPEMENAEASAKRSRFWQFLFLLIGAAAGGSWLMMTQLPGHEVSQLIGTLLEKYVADWQPGYLPWLVIGAGALGVLSLLLWMKEVGAKGRLQQLRGEVEVLLSKLDEMRAYRNTGESTEELGDLAEGMEFVYPDESRLEALRAAMIDYRAVPRDVREAVDMENAWLDSVMSAEEVAMDQLSQEIGEENERLRVQARLLDEQTRVRGLIDRGTYRIRVRETAMELIDGATKRLAQSFNRALRELTAETLPLFTEDRYQHIQLDDKLAVRVFSKDKGDFVDFDEISSGTQRQVMLAIRLSMSQLLARNTVKGAQFIFLDEPFAFFDEERTRHALQTLPQLTRLPQKWLVAQEFPDGADFARHITCSRYEINLKA